VGAVGDREVFDMDHVDKKGYVGLGNRNGVASYAVLGTGNRASGCPTKGLPAPEATFCRILL
jgi:hypothetical protein